MKSIRSLFESKYRIYWMILVCIIADAFFFYSKGLLRETFANFAYLEFIKNFPISIISSSRVEPLFIIVSFYLSRLIGSDILSIVILKNLIILFQLFTFYKIIKLFVKNNVLVLLSVIFLNFSFAYISMADNLLRNHLANLFFLISLYFIFKLFQSGKLTKTEIIASSLNGGILIYAHILPTIIFDFTLLFTILFLIFITLLAKYDFFKPNLKSPVENKHLLKTLIFIATAIFAIQSPYIIRLALVNAGIGDYKINNTSQTNTPTQTMGTVDASDVQSNTQAPSKSTPVQIKDFLIKTFRILFEYRLPGFSVFFIFLSFLSILFLLKNSLDISAKIPVLCLWLLTYLGSKSDLIFGIGTIPYRFSLMLIFPALLSLFVFLDYLIEKIKNNVGRVFLLCIMTLAFIGINLPMITEATILKNANNNAIKEADLSKMYDRMSINKDGNIFIVNGDSLEEINNTSTYLRIDSIFSTTNAEEIVSFMKAHAVNYVLFDNNRINESGNDIGSIVNTNLNSYNKSPYFINLGEYIGNTGTHITIFKFNPNGDTIKINNDGISFDCESDSLCTENFINAINIANSPIVKWVIEVYHNDSVDINEYAELDNGNILKISYQNDSFQNDIFLKNASIKLKEIEYRKTVNPIINIRVVSGEILLQNKNIDINYLNLEKFSIDNLTISGIINGNTLEYITLTRKGYETLVHISFFLLILMTYITFLIYQKIKFGKISIFEFFSKRDKFVILVLITLLIMDLIVGNMLFLEIYKKMIGI